MNERIKLLAVAAAPANSSIPHSEWNIPKEFIEKFAELIVRECSNVILEWKSEPFPLEPDFAAKMIRKHFGVE